MSASLAYKCIEFVNSKTDYSSFENIYNMFTTYNLITRASMNIFCCYVREKFFKKFRIEIDAFVSKKNARSLCVLQTADALSFLHEIINFIASRWWERKNYFSTYKMMHPRLNASLKWKNDYFIFEKIEKKKKMKRVEVLQQMVIFIWW